MSGPGNLYLPQARWSPQGRSSQRRDFFEISQRNSKLIRKQCQDPQGYTEDYPLRGPNCGIDEGFTAVAQRMMIEIVEAPQLSNWNPEGRFYFRTASQYRSG